MCLGPNRPNNAHVFNLITTVVSLIRCPEVRCLRAGTLNAAFKAIGGAIHYYTNLTYTPGETVIIWPRHYAERGKALRDRIIFQIRTINSFVERCHDANFANFSNQIEINSGYFSVPVD